MPIELCKVFKDTFEMTFASNGLNKIFYSKIYTTAFLTVVVLMIMILIYPCKKGTPMWILGKVGLYVFIASLVVIFIHDGVVQFKTKQTLGGNDSDNFIGGIGNDNVMYESGMKPSPITGRGGLSEYIDQSDQSNEDFLTELGV